MAACLGVDMSESMIEAARQRNKFDNLTYELGDAVNIPAEDASFDAAISTQVFEYVADCDAAIREMRRVLKAAVAARSLSRRTGTA